MNIKVVDCTPFHMQGDDIDSSQLKVIYNPPYMVGIIMSFYGMIGYHVTLSEGHMIANHPIYGVIDYHVTLSEGNMIASHPHDSQSPHIWGD